MKYVVHGAPDSQPLALIPGQGQSWWDYEKVLPDLAERFRVFAIDLRGQGAPPGRRAGTPWTCLVRTWCASSTWWSAP